MHPSPKALASKLVRADLHLSPAPMAPKAARKRTHEESEGDLHGVDILAAAAATALKSDGTGPSAGRTAGGKKGISANRSEERRVGKECLL